MLKTPAALLGMLGGDEMYVVKPGTNTPTLVIRATKKGTIAPVDMLITHMSAFSTYGREVTITYPNKETISVTIPGGSSSGESTVTLCWPIPEGSVLSAVADDPTIRYVPLVPAKSVGGGKPLLSSVLRKVRELRERFAGLFASVRYGYAD